MMLGKPIDLKDMEPVDWEYYNSLVWIKVFIYLCWFIVFVMIVLFFSIKIKRDNTVYFIGK